MATGIIRSFSVIVLFGVLTACGGNGGTMGGAEDGDTQDSWISSGGSGGDADTIPALEGFDSDPVSLEDAEDDLFDVFGSDDGGFILDSILALNSDQSVLNPKDTFNDMARTIQLLLAERDAIINQQMQVLAMWMAEEVKKLNKSRKKSEFKKFFKKVARHLTRMSHRAIEKKKSGGKKK